jgi:hypothetical protein
MNNYGFIITRHVTSEKTNCYWNNCVKLIKRFYPDKKIVIIDDNSDYQYINQKCHYDNIEIIQSEFSGRGELLPYYYYLQRKFFDNAVIIHDSVFFHTRIHFEKLHNVNVVPLWIFNSDKENIDNTKRLINHLKQNYLLHNMASKEIITLGMNADMWHGCFGVQSYIKLSFLQYIESVYNITNLIPAVKCRADRCCLERIFGMIFSRESPSKMFYKKSILGNIMKYQKWGYSYDDYMCDLKNGRLPSAIVKVWTGR